MTKPILDENANLCEPYFNFYIRSYYKKYTLTEAFIEKHRNDISWYWISYWQKLSNPFIAKYQDKLNFQALKQNKHINQLFIEKLELLK